MRRHCRVEESSWLPSPGGAGGGADEELPEESTMEVLMLMGYVKNLFT
jgi:hypothetical protein